MIILFSRAASVYIQKYIYQFIDNINQKIAYWFIWNS